MPLGHSVPNRPDRENAVLHLINEIGIGGLLVIPLMLLFAFPLILIFDFMNRR